MQSSFVRVTTVLRISRVLGVVLCWLRLGQVGIHGCTLCYSIGWDVKGVLCRGVIIFFFWACFNFFGYSYDSRSKNSSEPRY